MGPFSLEAPHDTLLHEAGGVVPFRPRMRPPAAPPKGAQRSVLPFSLDEADLAAAMTKMGNPLTPEQRLQSGAPELLDLNKVQREIYDRNGLTPYQNGWPHNDVGEQMRLLRMLRDATKDTTMPVGKDYVGPRGIEFGGNGIRQFMDDGYGKKNYDAADDFDSIEVGKNIDAQTMRKWLLEQKLIKEQE